MKQILSIVVTAYTIERLDDIFELLDSIKIQTYPHIEVIFVAERSEVLFDKVKSYAEENGINVKMLFNSGQTGLSAARNLGTKEAKGDIIAFVDDDVVLFQNWAKEMMKAYEDDSIIGVTGPALPLWENESMSWFPEEFFWIISCTAWSGWKRVIEVRNAWGMNMSFRKEAFKKAGLFKVTFGLNNGSRKCWFDPPSEDVDFSIRAKSATGKIIKFYPEVKVKHRAYYYRISQKFIIQRSFSVGFQRCMLKSFTQIQKRNLKS